MNIFGEKMYVPAIMGASGISKEQFKTCFYYAIATYILPHKIKLMPILAIIGPHGTEKSSLLAQLNEMVKEPTMIAAESIHTLRDKLKTSVTALIDKGDEVYEKYLIKLYEKKTANIDYKRFTKDGWQTKIVNIFGSTIIARRTHFKDSTTISRSIVIRTKYKQGQYQIMELPANTNGMFEKLQKW